MKDRSGETEEMEDEMEIPFETADAIENGTDGIGNAPEKEKEAGGQSDGVQKPREKEDNKRSNLHTGRNCGICLRRL